MEERISKRLHVSGLTPSITPADLSERFGKFGTVKALDGFGLLDGLGAPRRFGYVTLETTKPQLARCTSHTRLLHTGCLVTSDGGPPIGMNLLSGSTWKGAKLRIGAAKPDFRERYVIRRSASLP
jgi:RNA recognition motif-containing protein